MIAVHLSRLDVVLFSIECDKLLDLITNAIVYSIPQCQVLVNPISLTFVVAEVKP